MLCLVHLEGSSLQGESFLEFINLKRESFFYTSCHHAEGFIKLHKRCMFKNMDKIILNADYWKVPIKIVDSIFAFIKPNSHIKIPLRAFSLCLACQLKQGFKFQDGGFTISQGDMELQSLCVVFFSTSYITCILVLSLPSKAQ